jgi:signal transduction histidine kinase
MTNELERIFMPFRRLPEHRGEPGTSLGLFFTKNIVEQQGGRIWAESVVGEGTQFHVQLSRGSTPSK